MANDDDVTILFENNTVANVQDILSKTRNDIERKKEELRVMVGERYRDLIEAADTIAEMRESANAICNNIQTMEGLCESLQQRGLIGFKSLSCTGPDRLLASGTHYSVAVQVKLLVTIPETLWRLTERNQYLHATQLLLLAHHSHTALQLSPNAAKVSSWFPVIERQWASITQFRSTIVRGCSNLISTEVDDIQAVLDAMVSIMLVEGCNSSEIITRVLQLRYASLMSALAPKPSGVAKTQISQFVTLFIASLNIIYSVFAEGENGKSLLECRLKEVIESECEESSTVSLLQESSLSLSFLPQNIRQFRPVIQKPAEIVASDFVKSKMKDWLNSIFKEASESLSVLLSFTTTVKALAMIRSSIWEICKDKIDSTHWYKITNVLYGEKFDPWDKMVRYQVTEQARQIISSQLTSAKDAILQMATKLLQDIVADPKIASEEGDIRNFIWSESAGDLPDRVGWTSAASRNVAQAGGLYYKTRGYTSRLQTICRALNSRLTALIQDVGNFNSKSSKVDTPYISDKDNYFEDERSAAQDYSSLLSFLQDESSSTFIRLVSELENLAKTHKVDNVPERHQDWDEDMSIAHCTSSTILVVVGRLCQALPNVCPQMQMCASASLLNNPDVVRRMSLGPKMETESWSKVQMELQKSSGQLYGLFLNSLTDTLLTELKSSLTAELSAGGIAATITAFASWEAVTIEEEGEAGNIVKSSIHVPAHPTPALTHALSQLCTSVNCIAAHTITKNAQSALVANTCEAVTAAYEQSLEKVKQMNQTLALQLIFDLKFIQTVLLPRENKDLGGRLTSMIRNLEAKEVDPFDLDVFSSHILLRVKLSAQRVQMILGTIWTRDRQVVTGRIQSSSNSSTNNSIPMVMSVDIPRFSNVPLPVTTTFRSSIPSSMSTPALSLMAASNDRMSMKAGSLKDQTSPTTARKESSSALSASRSAASLFSAMSSSWFGGSSTSSS